MSELFRPHEQGQIARLIADNPLAWVIATGPGGGHAASPLPLLADLDDQGRVVRLLGHLARANPLAAALAADPQALILFQGPQSYISPGWVREPTWGPTWNYAVLRIEAAVTLRPDLNDVALHRLGEAMERGRERPWTPAQMGPRYASLARHIVAFEAAVTRLDARFKLGQDEKPEIFADILAGLGPGELSGLMRETNPDK